MNEGAKNALHQAWFPAQAQTSPPDGLTTLRLLCIPPRVPDCEVIGIKGVKNVLPPVRRLPGEKLLNMIERARHQARGSDTHMLVLQLRSEGAAP